MRRLLTAKAVLVVVLLLAAFMRLWSIDKVPVSLMADELDLGYQAYSFLKTGKDYLGNSYPIHFQSFPEWKTPLYIYSSVPTVALFGISPLGVRLPAVVFGIVSVWFFYLLIKVITGNWKIASLGALLLTVSPWHLQYSRAAFEAMEMFMLYLGGLYFFLRGLKNSKWLVLSAVFLALTPWAYSTAKLFLPLTLLAIIIIWRRELLRLPRKNLLFAAFVFLVVVAPITWSTVFGGGATRFNYISIFTDPTISPEVDFSRFMDARVRSGGKAVVGTQVTFEDKFFHNKVVMWGDELTSNYLKSFSTEFLFIKGDANLRHSPEGVGQFYRFEAIFMLLGIFFFFFLKTVDKKIKIFILFWTIFTPLSSILTRDGGTHATRLLLLLPPLLIFITFGVYCTWEKLKARWPRTLFIIAYLGALVASILFYQHVYWVHNPWDSERWWHAGWEETIKTAVAEGNNYDKVVMSTKADPPLIFFLAWSEYDPAVFQKSYPLEEVDLDGFKKVTRLGKYYFAETDGNLSSDGIISIEEIGQLLDENTLYVASEREVEVDLIHNPDKIPHGLVILKSIAYPSGKPAFYLFVKSK